MAEVINIIEYKIEAKRQKYFRPWKKRFKEDFDYFTRLSDLSDATLFQLGKKDEISEEAMLEFIMASLSLGASSKYYFLSDQKRRKISRLKNCLKRQVFFEIIRRLEWIVEYPCFRYSIALIVENFDRESDCCGRTFPNFSENFSEMSAEEALDPVRVKKFLDDKMEEALHCFKKRLENKGKR